MAKIYFWHPKIIFGLIISSVSLWFSLHLVSLSELSEAIIKVNPKALVVMMGFILLGLFFRTLRWLLVSGCKFRDFQSFFISNVLGVFGNFILPFRLGEIVRVLVIKKLLELPLTLCIGSSIIDRMLDFLMLLLGAIILIFIFPYNDILYKIFLFSFLFIITLCIIFIFLGRLRFEIEKFIKYIIMKSFKFFPGYNNSINFLTDIQKGVFKSLIYSLRFRTFVITTLVFCIDCLTLLVLIEAFSNAVPFYAGLLLWVFMSAASTLPSAPGFIGVYQVAAVIGLSLLKIDPAISIAIASVYQGIVLILLLLIISIIIALKGVGETKKLWTAVRSSK